MGTAISTPQIRFDEKFNALSSAEQICYLKKLCSSQNQALDMMQNERNALAGRCATAEASLVNCEQALSISKSTMTKQMIDGNANTQQLSTRIQKLQSSLKKSEAENERLRLGQR